MKNFFCKYKKYVLGGLFIIIIIPIFLEFIIFRNNFYSPVSNDGWASFFGSFFGGIIGGVLTLIGVIITINSDKMEKEEKIIKDSEPKFDFFLKQTDSIFSYEVANNETIHIIDTNGWVKKYKKSIEDFCHLNMGIDSIDELSEKIILSQHREEIHYLKIVNYDNFIYDFTIVYNGVVYFLGGFTPNSSLIFIIPGDKDEFDLYGKTYKHSFYSNISVHPNEMEYPYLKDLPKNKLFENRYSINKLLLRKNILEIKMKQSLKNS